MKEVATALESINWISFIVGMIWTIFVGFYFYFKGLRDGKEAQARGIKENGK